MIFDEDKCMNNTYYIVTGKKTVNDFLNEEDDLYFLHDPKKSTFAPNDPLYDTLIDYFIYTEEYEKCAEILEIKELVNMKILN